MTLSNHKLDFPNISIHVNVALFAVSCYYCFQTGVKKRARSSINFLHSKTRKGGEERR